MIKALANVEGVFLVGLKIDYLLVIFLYENQHKAEIAILLEDDVAQHFLSCV